MLASDLENPQFKGASVADSILHVEFYLHKALDTWKTQETGIKSYLEECPFIRMMVPGNEKTIIERPVSSADTRRFPQHWLRFQMETGQIANAENVPGWQLEEWSDLTEEQVRNLRFLRFYTVEQIAGANDTQVQAIGMGGQGLRARAQAALAEKNSKIVNSAVAERDAEIAELKAQMAELMALVKEKPKKRGRPPLKESA